MKKIQWCFYLCTLCCFNSLFAEEVIGSGLLFERFESGIVAYKNGACYSTLFNYDMLNQQMLFREPDGNVLVIGNSRDVLILTVGERRFFPITSAGAFYEEISAGKGTFFVKRKVTKVSEGKAAPFGGYSQTQSATSVGNWQSSGTNVNLTANEKFKLKIEDTYYLKIGNSYKRFSSAKSLGKLFKGHELEIKEFADNQSINFSKEDDIARIVEYGYSLIQ